MTVRSWVGVALFAAVIAIGAVMLWPEPSDSSVWTVRGATDDASLDGLCGDIRGVDEKLLWTSSNHGQEGPFGGVEWRVEGHDNALGVASCSNRTAPSTWASPSSPARSIWSRPKTALY